MVINLMRNSKHKNTQKKATTPLNLNKVFTDIDEWPESWAGDDDDILVGKIILEEFKRFLNEYTHRSKKTLQNYGNYLWALGGEIIRDTSENEIKKKNLTTDFLLNYVSESGGPYWRHANSESDQAKYDSTCRQFYRYLIAKHKKNA